MKKNLNEIKSEINRHLKFLEKEYHIKNIGIFGSMARGDFKKSSDIDILVELSRPIGFFKFLELEEFLSKILHRKVDLITKKALKEIIKEEILKETVYV